MFSLRYYQTADSPDQATQASNNFSITDHFLKVFNFNLAINYDKIENTYILFFLKFKARPYGLSLMETQTEKNVKIMHDKFRI